jgi:PAS domain S-box-containing protein
MKKELSIEKILAENEELLSRLEEAEQLIDAIKAGEVDAFALNRNNKPEIFTLQSGDYGYRMLVENFNEGALTLSDNGLVVYTNSYFHELLGVPYADVIGKPFVNFIASDCIADFEELFKNALTGNVKGEIKLHLGKKIIPVQISLTSLYPKLPIIGVIITDLTERKIFEKEINLKAEQLVVKNLELEKMNKDLESFAYISSHDLQEPLRKIQTFVGRIIDQESDNFSPSGQMMFNRMHLAAKRMQVLIDDLLAYSRSNSTMQEFEIIDLKAIIEDVKDDLKEEIKEKKATIETNGLCTTKIIPYQFRQMMHNLIGNSLKFARPGIKPKIKIKGEMIPFYRPLNRKACHISISDNGIGFDQEYSDKIFKVFQRLHTREEFAGTGIGLAIVKRIVENHEGIITVESEPLKGATFNIYIPAK